MKMKITFNSGLREVHRGKARSDGSEATSDDGKQGLEFAGR
jgi:hypothetical protein